MWVEQDAVSVHSRLSWLCRTSSSSSGCLWCWCPLVLFLPGFGALQPWVLSDMLHWYSGPVSDPHHCSPLLASSFRNLHCPRKIGLISSSLIFFCCMKHALRCSGLYKVIQSPWFSFFLLFQLPLPALLQLRWKPVTLASRCCIFSVERLWITVSQDSSQFPQICTIFTVTRCKCQ